MHIHSFMVPAVNSHVFQCTLRCRLVWKLRRAPIKSSVQISGFQELSKKHVWVGKNYSFKLKFETLIIWGEENVSYCFGFVNLDFHDKLVIYCLHTASL